MFFVRNSCCRFGISFLSKISRPVSIMNIKNISDKNNKAEEQLKTVQDELNFVKELKVQAKIQELKADNLKLEKLIEEAKHDLIKLETLNNKKQIPLPDQKEVKIQVEEKKSVSKPEGNVKQEKKNTEAKKPQGEKKVKEPKKENPKPVEAEEAIDVSRLDFRVGRIVEVSKHPDADSLYVEKIDCGEPNPRTVVSGLVKYIPIEEMQNRMVVILCNLKPAKMRGIVSEAMVMCASSPDKVEVLSPPSNAVPGDLVEVNGFPRKPDAQLNPKKKIFETCAPDLTTNDKLEACFKGVPWQIPGKGPILAQTLKAVNVK